MVTTAEAMDLFQTQYYGSLDAGEVDRAVEALQDDVELIHTQVWEHGNHNRAEKGTSVLRGKDAVEAELRAQLPGLSEHGVEHDVRHLVTDGTAGGFRMDVTGDGQTSEAVCWFRIEDGKIRRYVVCPVYY